jgi:ribosomal protein S18 acetylase RimI-like enzyme
MAVKPDYQNNGIGKKLLHKCVEFSKENNCNSLILYSNRKLKNAIHLYSYFGFKEISLEKNAPYVRANIKMELKLA